MKKLDLDVHGDIGCYDLTTLPPVSHMHSAFEMGASIPIEQGFTRAGGSEKGSIAVIGDSTFLHSGLTGPAERRAPAHQRHRADPGQQHHGHDRRPDQPRQREDARRARRRSRSTSPPICRALGVEHVETVDPYDYEACLDGAEGRARLRRPGRASSPTGRACSSRARSPATRLRGRRGALQRLPAVHEARLPVAAATSRRRTRTGTRSRSTSRPAPAARSARSSASRARSRRRAV